jgi:perosamine synthetase
VSDSKNDNIFDGQVPTQMNSIYMAGADIGDLEVEYVTDALKNGWYNNKYYYCETLEKEFAEYHNRKYALMTPNCTSAIHLILAAIGVDSSSEVIVPECTWIASAVSSHHLGAKLVFCDIEEDTWCLDPQSVRDSITENTKAIIAVDLFGNMANWSELEKISKEYDIPIIEDAAEALGSVLDGRRAGNFGLASTFSFHNTKTMTTGEGGMLLLDDDELFEQCVKFRDLGRGPDTKPYFNELIGYKFMPFNLQAALGLAQFRRIDELVAIKRRHLSFYRNLLSDLKIQFNYEPSNVINGAWTTALVLDKSYNMNKTEFINRLQEVGVPSRPFFYPLSSLPPFNLQDQYKDKNKTSYDISSRGINLPGASRLTNMQLKLVCDGIREVLS